MRKFENGNETKMKRRCAQRRNVKIGREGEFIHASEDSALKAAALELPG
jgi:hypothetical protein